MRLGWLALGTVLAHAFAFAAVLPSAEKENWVVDRQLRTVAEQSDFRATSSSDFVVEFAKAVSQTAPHIEHFEFGRTFEKRPMIAVRVSKPTGTEKRTATGTAKKGTDNRLVVLINANIHSGECCGKEAMLRMLRELAGRPGHTWLEDLVLVIVPNYNADGNDKVGRDNRPGQVGPAAGMGMRANAQQFDLNRDFIKLESPEARALVGLMTGLQPHCFIDLHTTNGSWHRYHLTYDIVHNPAANPLLSNLMRGRMMPAVTTKLAERSIDTYYYGNFNRNNTRWSTFDHRPRFGIDYFSLRGRIGILSEAYSYISFKSRIDATHAFVTECLNHLSANAQAIRETLSTVERHTIGRDAEATGEATVAIAARMTAFPGKVQVKGFDPPRRPRVRPAEAREGIAPRPPGKPKDYEVDFYGNFEATKRVQRPYAYIIPDQLGRVIKQLELHGVKLSRLNKDSSLSVEVYRCERTERAARAFQGHRLVTASATARNEQRIVPKNSVVVYTSQRLGNLIVYLLELESDDGLVTWNFYDDFLADGKDLPIVRLLRPTKLPVTAVVPAAR